MPRTYFGPYGENNSTYAFVGNANFGRWELGSYLILPDGRKYRLALNDGTVEVAGRLYQSVAPVGNHTNVAADVARAIGATAISATLGATSAAVDIYAEGLVHINDATGEGYAHRIKRAASAGDANAAAAASGVLTVNLAPSDTVQVALVASTSEVSFTRNRFHAVLIHPSPPTAMLAGVSPGVAAANRFYWSQVGGEAAVLASGTLLVGNEVAADITTDGAVTGQKVRVTGGSTAVADTNSGVLLEDQDGTETVARLMGGVSDATYDISGPIAQRSPTVGICVKVNASTEEALIALNLDH